MNEKQRLIEVRDQFALKNASDDTLRKILPSYRQAIDNIRAQLEFLPEGNIERELWLKTQLKTMERQFQQVASRIDDVLPPAQADQFLRALHNAKEYLEADGIKPAAAQQTALSGTTASGQTVTQTGNLPSVAGNDGFIRPSITRQQIEAASRTGGFSTFTLDDQVIKLEDVLPKWQKAQVANLERTLRTGFLLGETNEEIMRKFGPLGPGRKGWAMTEAVVRTGMAEASQAAHDAFFDANEDLLPKVPGGYRWEWDASNDTRLCPLCAPLDGMRYKTRAEMPAKPHWGCRCKKLPITATQAALRERGDVPEGSFLERKEVTYTKGKRNPPPAGYESVKRGGTAYARPQKIDGKMYWVRRRELPKGQTLAGDMIKRMDDKNKLAILGTKANVKEWNELIKLNAYKDDPQKLVRDLLGKGGRGPGRPPLPPKPPGSGPKPRPKTPAPKPAPAAPKPAPAASKPAPKPDTPTQSERVLQPGPKNELVFKKQGGTAKMFEDSFKQLEAVEGDVGAHARKMRQFMEKQDIVLHPSIPEKFANAERFKGNQALINAQRHAVEALEKQGNDPGALNGARSLLKALEEGNFSELKHVMGKASGAAGYTTRSSGIVNTAMSPSSTTFNKKKIQKMIADAEGSLKQQNAYIQYYKDYKPGTVAPKAAWDASGAPAGPVGPDQWLATSIHEVGHQVHFRGMAGTKLGNKYKGLGGEKHVSQYAHTNEREQFAEAFVHYVLNPKGLNESHPRLYKWVEDALEEALK